MHWVNKLVVDIKSYLEYILSAANNELILFPLLLKRHRMFCVWVVCPSRMTRGIYISLHFSKKGKKVAKQFKFIKLKKFKIKLSVAFEYSDQYPQFCCFYPCDFTDDSSHIFQVGITFFLLCVHRSTIILQLTK